MTRTFKTLRIGIAALGHEYEEGFMAGSMGREVDNLEGLLTRLVDTTRVYSVMEDSPAKYALMSEALKEFAGEAEALLKG